MAKFTFGVSDDRLKQLLSDSQGNGRPSDWPPLTSVETNSLILEVFERRQPILHPRPIPMILTCPACKSRHVDQGEFATKPHHTHACQRCGTVWRPAIVSTVGVRFLPGFKDEEGPPQTELRRALALLGFGIGDRANEQIGWRGMFGSDQKPLPPGCAVYHCEFCLQGHPDLTLIPHAETCPVKEFRTLVADF